MHLGPLAATTVDTPTRPVRIFASSHAATIRSSDSAARTCCGSHASGSSLQPSLQHVDLSPPPSPHAHAGSPSPPQSARSTWSIRTAAAAWSAWAWPRPPKRKVYTTFSTRGVLERTVPHNVCLDIIVCCGQREHALPASQVSYTAGNGGHGLLNSPRDVRT